MASWFVAALPWLVVVLALNYFLIMGMYGRGEASACDAVEDSPSDTVGAPGNAQSLEQSSLRCGTRLVSAAARLPLVGVGGGRQVPFTDLRDMTVGLPLDSRS